MPDPVFYVGDLVHYHPVIDGPHVGIPYRVWATSDLSDGRKVASLIGKTGCVAFEHLTLVMRATPDDRFTVWIDRLRIRSTNPVQRAHFNAWERLQDLASSQAEALEDFKRLTRELDVALNGEEGAAPQASLCDLVAQVMRTRAELEDPQ